MRRYRNQHATEERTDRVPVAVVYPVDPNWVNNLWEGRTHFEWESMSPYQMRIEEAKIANERKEHIKNIIITKGVKYANKLINENIKIRPIPNKVYNRARKLMVGFMLNIATRTIDNNINFLRFMNGLYKYRGSVVNYETILIHINQEIQPQLGEIYKQFQQEFK